jgi:hypothetical protein
MTFRDFYANKHGMKPGQWGDQYEETVWVFERMIDTAAEYLATQRQDRRVKDRRQGRAWVSRGPDRRSKAR